MPALLFTVFFTIGGYVMIYINERRISDEKVALWEQTKTHEICKDIDGIVERPFHIDIPAVSPYSKSTFLFADEKATTPEEIDKSVLEKLHTLDNLPYHSSDMSGIIPYKFNEAMKDGTYKGPYLADLMNMADAWEKSLKDTVDLLHELDVAENLSWKSFDDALKDRGMKSYVGWTRDANDKREKAGPYTFRMYADPNMGKFYGEDTDFREICICPEEHANTPTELLEKLEGDYMLYDRDWAIYTLAEEIFDDVNFSDRIPNYEMIFRGATLQCQKAANMADKLENALELSRDKSKEQTINAPEKSTPPWNPDVAKQAKEQSRSKSSTKNKDEIER